MNYKKMATRLLAMSLMLVATLSTAQAAKLTFDQALIGDAEGYYDVDFCGDNLVKIAQKEEDSWASRWGLMDKRGTVIVPYKYGKITAMIGDRYQLSPDPRSTSKSDYCNEQGEIVLPYPSEGVADYRFWGDDIIGVSYNEEWQNSNFLLYTLYTGDIEKISDCEYRAHPQYSKLSEDRLLLGKPSENGQDDYDYGYLDAKGQELTPFVYSGMSRPFSDGMAWVQYTGSDLWGAIDRTGTLVIPCQYEGVRDFSCGVAPVKKTINNQTRWAYIDKTGKQVTDFVYSDAGEMLNGFATVTRPYVPNGNEGYYMDRKYGLINTEGKEVIPCIHDKIEQVSDGYGEYSNKYVCVEKAAATIPPCAMFRTDGKQMTPFAYFGSYGMLENDLFRTATTDDEGYRLQKLLSDQGLSAYKRVRDVFPVGENLVIVEIPNVVDGEIRYGMTDYLWNEKIPFLYDDIIMLKDGYTLRQLNGLYQAYDPNGVAVGDGLYSYVRLYSNAETKLAPDDYTLVLDADRKYGIVDNHGMAVLDCQFYECEIDGDYAIVRFEDRGPKYLLGLSASANNLRATPNSATVLVDGKEVDFEAYTINQNNYFKLRDLAQALDGTKTQFAVDWDGTVGGVSMTLGTGYTSMGGELVAGDGTIKNAVPSTATFYLDGKLAPLTCYVINNNNFIQLRDLGRLLDFDVSWDGANQLIAIDSDTSYSET